MLQFLWVNDLAKDPPDVCILRFTRVVFRVSSSPFLLNVTIKYHLEQSSIWNLILIPFDACFSPLMSRTSSQDLLQKTKLLTSTLKRRKFLTNSRHLQLRIDQAEKSRNQPKTVREECPLYLDAEATLGSNPGQGAGEQRYLEYAGSQTVISSYLT